MIEIDKEIEKEIVKEIRKVDIKTENHQGQDLEIKSNLNLDIEKRMTDISLEKSKIHLRNGSEREMRKD